MIHYHGTPITPISALMELSGRHFCVSYARPDDLSRCQQIGQSLMLDNGAFTFWRQGRRTDAEWWTKYVEWVEPLLDSRVNWCVIPDVIDGTQEDNDRLILGWPRRLFVQSAPVWHMGESLDRLKRLANEWDRVCIGSSGAFANPQSSSWSYRMDAVFDSLIPTEGKPPIWIHMLRAATQATLGDWPFASTDSTNVAQNHARKNNPGAMAAAIDSKQAPPTWKPRNQTALALEGAA